MTYFAQIDKNGVVLRVIVADQAFIDSGAVGDPTSWIQTWLAADQRKNYAGIGYTMDKTRDAFIPMKPFPSWPLDEAKAQWRPPVPMPTDGKMYAWGEGMLNWTLVK